MKGIRRLERGRKGAQRREKKRKFRRKNTSESSRFSFQYKTSLEEGGEGDMWEKKMRERREKLD